MMFELFKIKVGLYTLKYLKRNLVPSDSKAYHLNHPTT